MVTEPYGGVDEGDVASASHRGDGGVDEEAVAAVSRRSDGGVDEGTRDIVAPWTGVAE